MSDDDLDLDAMMASDDDDDEMAAMLAGTLLVLECMLYRLNADALLCTLSFFLSFCLFVCLFVCLFCCLISFLFPANNDPKQNRGDRSARR